MDAAKIPKARFYRPELDVLRFIAFLLIFTHHEQDSLVGIGGIGGVGLPIFFLLSSFLITELLLREREQTGTIHLAAFFARRGLRIWPLYFAFIGADELLSHFGHLALPIYALNRGSFPFSTFAYFALLAGNWNIYFHGWFYAPVVPLWSLSIEEQFYLLWPTIARFGNRRAIAIASVIAYIVSFATLLYLCGPDRPRLQLWTNSFIQFRFFALGALLAIALHERSYLLKVWLRLLLLASIALAFSVAVNQLHLMFDGQAFRTQGPAYLLVDVGTIALFLSMYGFAMPSYMKPLFFLGKISYGLYVFHLLAIILLLLLGVQDRYLPALLLTFCFAVASYYGLELPFLKLKKRFVFVPNRVD